MWSFLKKSAMPLLKRKKAGKRVIAVGTTSVRSVETAALSAEENGNPDLIEPYFSDTSIFIYPGKSFRVVDALITNFHLPESTFDYVGICLCRL